MQTSFLTHWLPFRSAQAFIGLCLLKLVLPCSGEAVEPTFVHPGIAHTRASLQRVKQRLEASEEPWASQWNRLKESESASLQWKAEPWAHVERGSYNDPNIGASEFYGDGTAAYTLALRWALTGDNAYALKSAEIIDAWSMTLQSVGNHDAKLLVGMAGQKYCNAAELLRHTWDGWPEENQEIFREMLRNIWYPIIEDFFPSANGNWDASILQTMIAMAVFLDDREMFQRAVDYYVDGEGNGAVRNYFNEFGECQESGRDQNHTQMGMEFLANTCETAWNQGVDLYGAYDNRLLLGFEYTAKYNLGNDVRYEPYLSFEKRYHYKSISDSGRGRLRPMYDKVANHYHHRLGLPAEFTIAAANKVLTEPESRSRRKDRDPNEEQGRDKDQVGGRDEGSVEQEDGDRTTVQDGEDRLDQNKRRRGRDRNSRRGRDKDRNDKDRNDKDRNDKDRNDKDRRDRGNNGTLPWDTLMFRDLSAKDAQVREAS